MSKKYLAYISPEVDFTGLEFVPCCVTFISGDLDHQTFRDVVMPSNIFTYYYYGSTLEVVELDDNKNLLGVHDLTNEEISEFGISIYNVLTLNRNTFDMLTSNDFAYNLKVNKFYTYRKQTVENMFAVMNRTDRFILRVYVIKGAIVYIHLNDNPDRDSKYVLSSGFIVTDKSKLRGSSVSNSGITNSNAKLKQEDIDKLITKIQG